MHFTKGAHPPIPFSHSGLYIILLDRNANVQQNIIITIINFSSKPK